VLAGVRGPLPPRRRAGRDGAAVPALEDPGRVDALRALKHDGTLPIIGVNTWLDPATTKDGWEPGPIELRRASPEEKQDQIRSVREFQARHADESGPALARLQQVAMAGGNVFAELMSTVRVATLGQITKALYAVGGEYRRNL
jgi:methylmalonyl-CoA mutase